MAVTSRSVMNVKHKGTKLGQNIKGQIVSVKENRATLKTLYVLGQHGVTAGD